MVLARPLTLRSGLTIPNRLAKAALTEGLADARGQPTARLRRLYARWALGGAGLVITGNVMVDGRYLERPGNVVVEGPGCLDALVAWAAEATGAGTPALVQLNHPGRQANRFVCPRPPAPSSGPAVRVLSSFGRPRAMRAEEVEEVVARFAAAAALAQRAGFAGVEVHAAHGYLLSQFLSPLTNERHDRWGGDLEGRARLLVEVVRAVRSATGPRFTLAVKLNSADFQRGGFGEDDALAVVALLESEAIDLLEISGGNYESPALLLGPPEGEGERRTTTREAFFLEFARRARRVTSLPLMVTGGFRSAEVMTAAIEEGALDVVGLGRPLALDPDLPRKLLAGQVARSDAPLRPARGGALGALEEAAWYGRQLERLADGAPPALGASAGWQAVRHVGRQLLGGLAHRVSYRPPAPPEPRRRP